ncbi:MAG: hypothetical protein ACNA7U_03630 [Candidatus Izemoplasmataceae bacterium]
MPDFSKKPRKLPKDTKQIKHFEHEGTIYAMMEMSDGRFILMRVRCWADGSIMNFGFINPYGNVVKNGINTNNIIRVYEKRPKQQATILRHIDEYLKKYTEEGKHTNEKQST